MAHFSMLISIGNMVFTIRRIILSLKFTPGNLPNRAVSELLLGPNHKFHGLNKRKTPWFLDQSIAKMGTTGLEPVTSRK